MDEWKPKSGSISLSLRKRRPKSSSQTNASNSSQSSQRSLTSLSWTPSQPAVAPPPPTSPLPTPQQSTCPMPDSNQLLEYNCPICSQDLSHLRSSYLRQSHVDKCLTGSAAAETITSTSSQDEFTYCIFCGKDVSKLKELQKDLHFGRCLDQLGELESNTFAGQSVPLIDELATCPVCHQSANCNQHTTTKRKLQHIKSCMKSRNMSMNTLLQKLRWVQWGHKPVERPRAPQLPSSSSSSSSAAAAYIPQRPTTVHVTEVAEGDDDFSSNVMFHRRPKIDDRQQQRYEAAEDAMDEELQLALALSRSQAEMEPNSNIHQQPFILDPDESRQVVKTKLNNISTHIPNAPIRYNLKPLSPSKLQASPDTTPYWDLATTHNNKQDCTYLSKFLINLHHP
ncbi:hypothetical protein K492DRAFT_203913 [Lichtheimia hyalospora FSU 10163]|nr:hypothetical protein K492DRAFT_203913 [Lichtheimia hyalospora FSU 10163]